MDPYEVLGIENTASEEEIKNRYKNIIEEYSQSQDDNIDMKIKMLKTAYEFVINEYYYKQVRQFIQNKNFIDAEGKLNLLNNLNSAEWNYLKGFISVQKGWFESGLNFIKKATELEPDNIEYLNSLNQLQSRIIEYMKIYSSKKVQPNNNSMNACNGENNNGGMC